MFETEAVLKGFKCLQFRGRNMKKEMLSKMSNVDHEECRYLFSI